MASDAILLGDVAAQITHIIIACRTCRGRSRLGTNELVDTHGPDLPMSALLGSLTRDCPRLDSWGTTDRCDVHSPTRGELFGPGMAQRQD
jgi:hypothetical protein